MSRVYPRVKGHIRLRWVVTQVKIIDPKKPINPP
jgi:hypothetical protein